MKSIANLLYDFAVNVENDSTGEMKDCEILPHIFEQITAAKTLAIVDSPESEPKPSPSNEIRDYNAIVAVEILARPELVDGRYDFVTAREKVKLMADEFIGELYKKPHINSGTENVCQIQVVKKRDNWTMISTVRYAVTTILLKANSY